MRSSRITVLVASLLVAAAAVVLVVTLIGSDDGAERTSERAWTDVTPQQLAAMLAGEDRFVVNVHVPYEGELAGTDAFIPYDEIGKRLDQLPSDRNAAIVLYCRSGRMSLEAARTLVAKRYTSVYNLVGGFDGWRAAGYELIVRKDVPASR